MGADGFDYLSGLAHVGKVADFWKKAKPVLFGSITAALNDTDWGIKLVADSLSRAKAKEMIELLNEKIGGGNS